MLPMFLLKIMKITQFKFILYSFVCNHILDRLHVKMFYFIYALYPPHKSWIRNLNLLFSFLQFSISPYLYHDLFSSFFEEEITTETSKIICSIHWNQGAFKIGSVLIKNAFWNGSWKIEQVDNIKLKNIDSLFPVKWYFIFILLRNIIEPNAKYQCLKQNIYLTSFFYLLFMTKWSNIAIHSKSRF